MTSLRQNLLRRLSLSAPLPTMTKMGTSYSRRARNSLLVLMRC